MSKLVLSHLDNCKKCGRRMDPGEQAVLTPKGNLYCLRCKKAPGQ